VRGTAVRAPGNSAASGGSSRAGERYGVADATDPLAVADAVVFFSMAATFPAAALGAEGMAADVSMLVGNRCTPGHAALDLYRWTPGVRALIDLRVSR